MEITSAAKRLIQATSDGTYSANLNGQSDHSIPSGLLPDLENCWRCASQIWENVTPDDPATRAHDPQEAQSRITNTSSHFCWDLRCFYPSTNWSRPPMLIIPLLQPSSILNPGES